MVVLTASIFAHVSETSTIMLQVVIFCTYYFSDVLEAETISPPKGYLTTITIRRQFVEDVELLKSMVVCFLLDAKAAWPDRAFLVF